RLTPAQIRDALREITHINEGAAIHRDEEKHKGGVMPEWNEADLRAQFERAKRAGWLPLFRDSAEQHKLEVSLLLGIASRETNIRQIKGDFRNGIYHGYGLMQIDIGTDRKFCEAWTPDMVAESIERGAQILAGKRAYLVARGISDPRAWAAAYNTGEG